MKNEIHEQVYMQLEHLKYWVDAEINEERRCKEWGIRYTPSRRKWENISQYEEYKREVEKNGDKNLLVWVNMNGEDGINIYGVRPFARRYVGKEYLVHRNGFGGEILLREDRVNILKM